MKILIVEDEIRLADTLGHILQEQKYLTDIVYDGRDGLDYALSGIYDVIILDVMLPRMNGFEVVRTLRQHRIATPVLMLTAKDKISDKVNGLDCGSDDYLTKPFITEELLARLRALTRRQGEVVIDTLTYHDIILNLSACQLSCGNKNIHLGLKEFEVLRILMSNSGRIVSKEDLITKVWGENSEAEDNNVEAYISFLRKKFAYLNSQVLISTQRKVGYFLEVNHD